MQIIPVIDIKGGAVVHAVRGERGSYQPIHHISRLVSDSKITSIIDGFLKLHSFSTMYIADLDAICKNSTELNSNLIKALSNHYPDICFWIDSGRQLSEIDTADPMHFKTVIGTESQSEQPGKTDMDFILSLDFKNRQRYGHAVWFENPALWPDHIIIMTLNRVGDGHGPDFDKLAAFSTAHPDRNWVAAGGIRNREDLVKLADMGIHTALLATALHNGTVSATVLTELQAKKYPDGSGYF